MPSDQKVKATDAANELEERVIEIRRVSKVTKGGKTISFRAVSVVGNRNGKVGLGVGNAREVPQAIRKSIENAKNNLIDVPVRNGTIPYETIGEQDASTVLLFPAGPGTGVIASSAVRAVVELAGIDNILSKSISSTNVLNLAKATYNGLKKLRSPQEIAKLRDLTVKQVFFGAHEGVWAMSSLKIKLVRGRAGKNKRQLATLDALDLTRKDKVVIKPDNPQIRGMIRTVHHLVEWEEIDS